VCSRLAPRLFRETSRSAFPEFFQLVCLLVLWPFAPSGFHRSFAGHLCWFTRCTRTSRKAPVRTEPLPTVALLWFLSLPHAFLKLPCVFPWKSYTLGCCLGPFHRSATVVCLEVTALPGPRSESAVDRVDVKFFEARTNTTATTALGSIEPTVLHRYGLISSVMGLVAMAAGILVLMGWLTGIRTLTSVLPDYATIKVNTAFCFILAGLSIWLLRHSSAQPIAFHPNQGRFGQVCALLVGFVGLLTIGEYCLRLNFGIDEAFLHDIWTDARISPPGRMSIATAFGFFVVGSSLFFLGRKKIDDVIASQILALSGLIAGVFACLGYVYGVQGQHSISLYTTMAVHTASVLTILCVAILLARPDHGVISALTRRHNGRQIALLILPLSLTLPFLIGWLQLKGERAGLYGTEFGLALFATANIILFTILVWLSTRSLNRRTAESAQLAGAKEKLQAVLDAATHLSIVATDTEGLITVFNRGAEQMLGYASDEIVDKQSSTILYLEPELTARGRELTEELGKPVEGFDILVEKARIGQCEEREWTYVRKDGETLRVNVVVTAARDTNGAITGFLGVAMDITARTKVEKELKENRVQLGSEAGSERGLSQ
jgi:PAS domain S-box-containing protein